MKARAVTLAEIEDSFQTGDLLFARGNYPSSKVIEVLEGSPWSHVCMVVRASDVGLPAEAPPLLIWEANDLTNLPDWSSGKPEPATPGPLLVDLVQRLQTDVKSASDVGFSIRQLHVERTPEMLQQLAALFPSMQGWKFPPTWQLVWNEFLGRILHKASPPGTIFCSELVARSYMTMGVMSRSLPDNAYEPRDYTKDKLVPLLERAFLGPLTLLNLK